MKVSFSIFVIWFTINIPQLFCQSTITGSIFHDYNADGKRQISEPEIDSVATIYLMNLQGEILQSYFALEGHYVFDNVSEGSYTLKINLTKWKFSPVNAIGDSLDLNDNEIDSDFSNNGVLKNNINIQTNGSFIKRDAGIYALGSIGGSIWAELDENSYYDSNNTEFKINEVLLLLYRKNIIIDSALTNSFGSYVFKEIKPDTYTIVIPLYQSYNHHIKELRPCISFSESMEVLNDNNGYADSLGAHSVPIILLSEGPSEIITNNTIDFCFIASDCDLNQKAALNCAQVGDPICNIFELEVECARMESTNPNPFYPLCNTFGNSHNSSWFCFIAPSKETKLTISFSNCFGYGDTGGQVGIFYLEDNCDLDTRQEVFCHSSPPIWPGTHVEVPFINLVPGNKYYLWIDGYAASICDYSIEVESETEQFHLPQSLRLVGQKMIKNSTSPHLETIESDSICLGQEISVLVDGIDEDLDAKYSWKITAPNGGINFITNNNNSIYFKAEQIGNYIVELYNIETNCQNDFKPISIVIYSDLGIEEDFGIHELCENYLNTSLFGPWMGPDSVWNTNISDPNNDGWPGWHTKSNFTFEDVDKPIRILAENPLGCKLYQNVQIKLHNNPNIVYIDTTLFEPEILNVGPFSFNYSTEIIDVVFPSSQGCDSVVWVTLRYLLDTSMLVGDINYECHDSLCSIEFINTYHVRFHQGIQYFWLNDNGDTLLQGRGFPDPLYTNLPGVYRLILYVPQSDLKFTLKIDLILNNVNLSIDNQVIIYPNPGSELIFVESDKIGWFTIFDVNGKEVIKQKIYSGKNQINVSSLARGLYFGRYYSSFGFSNIEKIILP